MPLALAVTSCQKKPKGEETQPLGAPSPVEIRFQHKVSNFYDLQLNTKIYNLYPSVFNITEYKYYISNIWFVRSDNNDTVKLPDTYFLVDHKKPESMKLQFTVPAGSYYLMSFLLGIDSARNFSGPKTGALDPSLGMYFNANDGYIMGYMEGQFGGSNALGNTYSYRIGGVKGPYNVLSRRYFKIGGIFEFDPTRKTVINMVSDAMTWLTTPNGPDWGNNPVINAPGEPAFKISQNYHKMFYWVSTKYE